MKINKFGLIFFLVLTTISFFHQNILCVEPEPGKITLDTTENLTAWAWQNYKNGNYDRAIKWAKLCTFFWGPRAVAQTSGLNSYPSGTISEIYSKCWALNDVGTCWLIVGESFRKRGDTAKAEIAYRMLTDENHRQGKFYFAQCASEPSEGLTYLWKPADVAYARLIGYTEEKLNNVGLMKSAWGELEGDREKARKFAKLCIDMYIGKLPEQWVINDLGTCWFIIGEAWRKDGNQTEANQAYQEVIDNYPTSQCYDPATDSYWSVAEAAKEKIR